MQFVYAIIFQIHIVSDILCVYQRATGCYFLSFHGCDVKMRCFHPWRNTRRGVSWRCLSEAEERWWHGVTHVRHTLLSLSHCGLAISHNVRVWSRQKKIHLKRMGYWCYAKIHFFQDKSFPGGCVLGNTSMVHF